MWSVDNQRNSGFKALHKDGLNARTATVILRGTSDTHPSLKIDATEMTDARNRVSLERLNVPYRPRFVAKNYPCVVRIAVVSCLQNFPYRYVRNMFSKTAGCLLKSDS